MTFQDLGLIAPILGALADLGYERPSPIQEKAIPPALAGRDVLGCAQTGTGKTCAFATPILQRLQAKTVKGHPIRALILTPTRELALQIQESFQAYGKGLKLRSAVIFGGVGQAPQVERLKKGVDILVATPGRLIDLYQQKLLDFGGLEILVLDEADRMLDMGFIHDVKKILQWLPKEKQTLFFSATMPPEITDLVNSLLRDPVKVAVNPVSSPVEVIRQQLYYVDRGNKTRLLAYLLDAEQAQSALVFTCTKHGANKVAGDLMKAGIPAAAIHGNKSQTARQQALSDFKSGAIRVLVATDIAARGLDIEELSYVFNYNLPDVPETYVHRIGRTGRAGHGGTAISFCDVNEKEELKGIEKLLGRPIPVVEDHLFPMEVLEPLPRDKKGRVVNPEDAEAWAAARERRAARKAQESKEGKASKKQPKAQPAPVEASAPAPKKRPKAHRASATLEEALVATAPKTSKPGRNTKESDFRHPDPLSGDTIMDATARLLAPRSRTVQEGEKSPRRRNGKGSKASQSAPKSAQEQSQKEPSRKGKGKRPLSPLEVLGGNKKRKRRSGGGSPREVELRTDGVKDSTELSASLMKPYYLSDDT
ncbi:MAG TPA: DEAD/DEAH box helicase [Candidatus Flavonifractor merdigallinarum]|uniref:ATP-dependent RNA helicase CshA n=1 Tax=Candidatus Flavonifractor merdigallinarum TaxID=2838589 RepID=A0A9D2BZ40_9FIRM|nr:DEAD/DEAH box helicase [Candidatus Flavonifractor merdigallinarum]